MLLSLMVLIRKIYIFNYRPSVSWIDPFYETFLHRGLWGLGKFMYVMCQEQLLAQSIMHISAAIMMRIIISSSILGRGSEMKIRTIIWSGNTASAWEECSVVGQGVKVTWGSGQAEGWAVHTSASVLGGSLVWVWVWVWAWGQGAHRRCWAWQQALPRPPLWVCSPHLPLEREWVCRLTGVERAFLELQW